jgi:hypothetical protein
MIVLPQLAEQVPILTNKVPELSNSKHEIIRSRQHGPLLFVIKMSALSMVNQNIVVFYGISSIKI